MDCAVPLILGMEFLGKVRPLVDFRKKEVSVVHAERRYKLPTCVIGSSGRCEEGV